MATLTIRGLPQGCPFIASDSFIMCGPPAPILVDELVMDTHALPIERLLTFAEEHANNRTNQIYIVDYVHSVYSDFEMAERRRLIRDFLVERGRVPRPSITIVTSIADAPNTRLYRVPPGASNPQP